MIRFQPYSDLGAGVVLRLARACIWTMVPTELGGNKASGKLQRPGSYYSKVSFIRNEFMIWVLIMC
jgi:hypothetical protein